MSFSARDAEISINGESLGKVKDVVINPAKSLIEARERITTTKNSINATMSTTITKYGKYYLHQVGVFDYRKTFSKRQWRRLRGKVKELREKNEKSSK